MAGIKTLGKIIFTGIGVYILVPFVIMSKFLVRAHGFYIKMFTTM